MNYLLFAALFLAQPTEPVGVPSGVPIVIGVILLLLFWWGLSRNTIPQGTAVHDDHYDDSHHGDDHVTTHDEHDAHSEVVAVATPVAIETALETAVAPDDLKIIEGIGPKIESILHDAGIKTFAELAAASPSQLEKIVREDAGIRVAFPDTWPEQGRLAAEGKWDELEKLKDDLQGGRRA